MTLEEETRNVDMALLEQYKKELSDLENGIGLAKCISKSELNTTKQVLREAIGTYKGYLY